ncbi:MAG: hypothetical protein A4E57_04190 [Syntrophorhabdaceae bacterium PtaU1.Bin034]|nr:MAG: hypothetical protein A4E57_04190 [Syntrophorhabdaceae bacterium PtaU1.Bin034]
MRLTKTIRGAKASLISFFSHKDALVLFGIFALAFVNWGDNVLRGQTYEFIVLGLMAASLLLGDAVLSILGLYLSCWFAYLMWAGFYGAIPAEILFQSLDTMTFIFAGMGVYMLVRRGQMERDRYMNWICTLTAIFCVLALAQITLFRMDVVATLGNRNFLAAWLAISFPLFLRRKWMRFIPLIAICLLCTKTSSAISAALMATAFCLWGWKGAGIAIIPAVAYYLVFKLSVHNLSLGIRLEYWQDALSKISNSWQTILFGVGPGVYWRWGNEFHSEPVYILFNLGIFGLAIVAAYIFRSFRAKADRRLQAAFLAALIDSFGNHVMHVALTALLIIIILALKDRTEGAT